MNTKLACLDFWVSTLWSGGLRGWEVKRLVKGLERQRLKESAVAGFNHARTITMASAKGLDTQQDDYNRGICSPGSLVNNPVR